MFMSTKKACFFDVISVVELDLVFAFCSVVELGLVFALLIIKFTAGSHFFERRIRIFLLVWFVIFSQVSSPTLRPQWSLVTCPYRGISFSASSLLIIDSPAGAHWKVQSASGIPFSSLHSDFIWLHEPAFKVGVFLIPSVLSPVRLMSVRWRLVEKTCRQVDFPCV